ncbi:hypothetical protein ON010_g18457 [Phytophthora cinnamomi]|nr:hypothetical protein ON010_g18457 [Phytophthora cinnamomi]
MQLAAGPARAEPSTASGEAIPKTLEDAIIRLMRTTAMRTPSPQAPRGTLRVTSTNALRASNVNVEIRTPTRRGRRPRRHVRLGRRDAWKRGRGFDCNDWRRLRLSASSELKEFQGRDSSEGKARAWLNRLKSDGMTGEEVCGLFSDLMNGPARQWCLQLPKKVTKSWS